jgi:hypothetical protein
MLFHRTGCICAAGFHHVMARSRLAWVRGQRKMCQVHMYVHTGRVWTAGFHHVTVRSLLAHGLKLMNRLFL